MDNVYWLTRLSRLETLGIILIVMSGLGIMLTPLCEMIEVRTGNYLKIVIVLFLIGALCIFFAPSDEEIKLIINNLNN